MTEVLAWLAEHHPDLHPTVEQDRDWLWITADLRGEQNKATRESINHEGGFRFAKRGHPLPSGKVAYWGHSCNRPMAFKRGSGKSQSKKAEKHRENGGRPQGRLDPLASQEPAHQDMEDLAAAFV